MDAKNFFFCFFAISQLHNQLNSSMKNLHYQSIVLICHLFKVALKRSVRFKALDTTPNEVLTFTYLTQLYILQLENKSYPFFFCSHSLCKELYY